MTHDPLCPISYSACPTSDDQRHGLVLEAAPGYYLCDTCLRECHCTAITTARHRERAWVAESAAEEIKRHVITGNTCACFEENITDPRLHHAEIVRYVADCLLPEHQVQTPPATGNKEWAIGEGHDALCPQSEGKWDGGCQCDLIAKVRADQNSTWVQIVRHRRSDLQSCDKPDHCHIKAEGAQLVLDDAIALLGLILFGGNRVPR